MAADRANQTLTLPDGRKLGYAEWGDLNGKPVCVFGGSNSARFVRHPDESILHEMGVHQYTFDRPGMGLSDYQPARTLLDWAKDIRAFADAKGIQRFAVVAGSQGGPYGAACAYALSNRLSSVTLVSAVSPMDDPATYAAQSQGIKVMIQMGRRAPSIYGLIMNLTRPMVMRGDVEQLTRRMLSSMPPSDQKIMDSSGLLSILGQDIREALRQGGKGAADDLRVCVNDWGFKLEDIRARVFVWHGEDDRNVPLISGHYFAAHIPHAEATFVPNAGHFVLFSHWRQILAQLLPLI